MICYTNNISFTAVILFKLNIINHLCNEKIVLHDVTTQEIFWTAKAIPVIREKWRKGQKGDSEQLKIASVTCSFHKGASKPSVSIKAERIATGKKMRIYLLKPLPKQLQIKTQEYVSLREAE